MLAFARLPACASLPYFPARSIWPPSTKEHAVYIVAAQLVVEPEQHDRFKEHVLENARMARTTEKGCCQFDVCVDPQQPGRFFLYEVYDDRAAFETHQASAHLLAFREKAGGLLKSREVRFYERIAP